MFIGTLRSCICFCFSITTPQAWLMALDWMGARFAWPCGTELFLAQHRRLHAGFTSPRAATGDAVDSAPTGVYLISILTPHQSLYFVLVSCFGAVELFMLSSDFSGTLENVEMMPALLRHQRSGNFALMVKDSKG